LSLPTRRARAAWVRNAFGPLIVPAGLVAVLGWLAVALPAGCGAQRPPGEAPQTSPARAPTGPASADPLDDDDREPPPALAATDRVTIKLWVDAHWKAHVFWGRKDLGVAPLEIQRPRGSGPLDLLIVADGALPLHTRVFTDRDSALPVRLYGESEAPSLLGYPRSFSLPTSARFTHNAGTFPRPRR
jgi:hypothetical protein